MDTRTRRGSCSTSTPCWRMCSCRASVPNTTWRPCGPRPQSGARGRLKASGSFAALTLGDCLDYLRIPIEDFSQVGWWFDPMFFHHLEQAQDVAHSCERYTFLACQVLNDLHLADVAL